MSFPPVLSCVTLHIWCTHTQMAMASTPTAAVPFVITFGYNNFTQGPNKRTAKCNICGIKIKDAVLTTPNYIRHLKMHQDRSVTES